MTKQTKLTFTLSDEMEAIVYAIVSAVAFECTGVHLEETENKVTVRMDPDYDHDTFDIVIDWGVEN